MGGMTETPADAPTYSSDDDVAHLLGRVGSRLPDYVRIPTFRAAAYAQMGEALGAIYPTVPEFTKPAAVAALRWAEAKLAAADILDVLAADLSDDVRELPERWRAQVAETLAGGVVGYPPGSTAPDGEEVSPTYPATPSVSHRTPGMLTPNPYDPETRPGWLWPL